MSIRNKLDEVVTSLKVGAPVKIANDGKPMEHITIRYKDVYFFIGMDIKSGEPTGDFGWSEDPTMNPEVAIRDIWIANPPHQHELDNKA